VEQTVAVGSLGSVDGTVGSEWAFVDGCRSTGCKVVVVLGFRIEDQGCMEHFHWLEARGVAEIELESLGQDLGEA